MKTFKEIRGTDTEDLTESRLLRRGIATGYGLRARNEGKKVEMELNSAKNALRPRPNDTTEEQVKRLQEGLIQMCDANIALRHQLGAITAIVVSGQLFNERTNTQLERIIRDYSSTVFIYLTLLSTARDKKTFGIDQATLREIDGVSGEQLIL